MSNVKDLHNLNKKLMLVEYPGVVENEELAVKTLGGMHKISTTYSLKNRRLELRFRPDDALSKPACGDRHQTLSLLLKVKVKRKKNRQASEGSPELVYSEDSEDSSNYSDIETCKVLSCDVSVLGCVHTAFRFRNLCDFQYVPMYLDENKTNVCNYDHIVPINLPDPSWLQGDGPHFLPPAAFSRMDTMQHYLYRREPREDTSTPAHIIGRTRSRRSGHAVFLNFDVPKVPSKPRAIAMKLLRVKFLNGSPFENMKKMFEERPVWSKSAVMFYTEFTRDQLKYLLPAVAYYFVTGPWRVMWVRFGYDPRAVPQARIYQTLDYRIRAVGGLKTKVKAKRSYCNYVLPYKSSPSCKPKTSVITKENIQPQGIDEAADGKNKSESMFIFRPGMIPSSRQMFYQYCDVHVPEIQEMIDKLPYPPPGTKCHERLGWLPSGMDDRCREIINNLVLEVVKKDAMDGTEGASPKKGRSDEEDTEEDDEVEEEEEEEDDSEGMEDYEDEEEEEEDDDDDDEYFPD